MIFTIYRYGIYYFDIQYIPLSSFYLEQSRKNQVKKKLVKELESVYEVPKNVDDSWDIVVPVCKVYSFATTSKICFPYINGLCITPLCVSFIDQRKYIIDKYPALSGLYHLLCNKHFKILDETGKE